MILDDIVDYKKQFLKDLPDVNQDSLDASTRNFAAAFSPQHIAVIAELKSQSPSAGVICHDYHPEKLATLYQQGGANAISVLTDEKFFAGSYQHLQAVEQTSDVPLLCKDFIIDKKQIHHARQNGADACLLIVSILSERELQTLKDEIEALNMHALIEVFNQEEIQCAMAVNPHFIDINNRNLKNFTIDMNNTEKLCELIPEPIKVVSASGIKQPQEIQQLPKRIDGVLIGTALMESDDPRAFIQAIHRQRESLQS